MISQEPLDELFGCNELDMGNLSDSWKPGSTYMSYSITPQTVKDGRTSYHRHYSPHGQIITPHAINVVDLTTEPTTKKKASSTVTIMSNLENLSSMGSPTDTTSSTPTSNYQFINI